MNTSGAEPAISSHPVFLWLLQTISALSAENAAAWSKITPRAALAAGACLAVLIVMGPWWIGWLAARCRDPLKSDSAEIARLHSAKHATPTMGGLLVVAGISIVTLLFGDWNNALLPAALATLAGLTLIGAIDDLVKIHTPRNGLSARAKLALQTLTALAAAGWLYRQQAAAPDGLLLYIPLAGKSLWLGWWFVPLAAATIVGASNAVNLSDGLDGLAGGCLLIAAAAMTALVYIAGHAGWAAYLGVPYIPQAGELTILGGATIGAILGFLRFNCHPAQVFLGNAGSLPLGGLLGVLAVAARMELVLLLVGGVFVAETISVILQVGYYKWRRRRLFRCAPLHHHFQLLGWTESTIVARFWFAAALCALLGVGAIKIGTGLGS